MNDSFWIFVKYLSTIKKPGGGGEVTVKGEVSHQALEGFNREFMRINANYANFFFETYPKNPPAGTPNLL
jgi:hypothetical protein